MLVCGFQGIPGRVGSTDVGRGQRVMGSLFLEACGTTESSPRYRYRRGARRVYTGDGVAGRGQRVRSGETIQDGVRGDRIADVVLVGHGVLFDLEINALLQALCKSGQ